MRRINFDLDALRTFATGFELGSFARAADRIGRSPSAVSAQLKKLEEQAGVTLLQKSGRGLVLTDKGEIMLSYAKHILRLNDEAVLALTGSELEGKVRLGLQEDFSEHLLPSVLGKFTRGHKGVHIEVKVDKNAALLKSVRNGELDLALGWHTGPGTSHMSILGDYPLHWIGPRDAGLLDACLSSRQSGALSLVTFDAPCRLRRAATEALDAVGAPWRVVYSSPSLSGVWAAVAAGLGVSVRTRFGLPSSLMCLAPAEHQLPDLPRIELALHRAQHQLPTAAARLHDLIIQCVLDAT